MLRAPQLELPHSQRDVDGQSPNWLDTSTLFSFFESEFMLRNLRIAGLHVVAAAFLVTLTGCGNGLSSLQGTVQVDGSPAPAGISLQFSPVSGGSPSYAETDDQGRYEAAFTFREKGIEAGEHIVSLTPGGGAASGSMPVIGEDGRPVTSANAASNGAAASFPQKYYSEITRITVEPGANDIDIELESQK